MKKHYQCSQCKKWFSTKGGIERHNKPFPLGYRNHNKRPSRCQPEVKDSYKHD